MKSDYPFDVAIGLAISNYYPDIIGTPFLY